MNQALNKITPKAPKAKAPAPPAVSIQVPEVHVNAGDFAAAIEAMATQFSNALKGVASAIRDQEERMARMVENQQKVLKALAEKETPAPVVNIPARPKSFYVELDKDDGETVGMRISAESSH